MSKAFRCDKCKQCFAPERGAEFVSIKEIIFGDSEYFNERIESVDLCYKCSAEFKSWLKKGSALCETLT